MNKFIIFSGSGSPISKGARVDNKVNRWLEQNNDSVCVNSWQFIIDPSTSNQFICLSYWEEYNDIEDPTLEANERYREE